MANKQANRQTDRQTDTPILALPGHPSNGPHNLLHRGIPHVDPIDLYDGVPRVESRHEGRGTRCHTLDEGLQDLATITVTTITLCVCVCATCLQSAKSVSLMERSLGAMLKDLHARDQPQADPRGKRRKNGGLGMRLHMPIIYVWRIHVL